MPTRSLYSCNGLDAGNIQTVYVCVSGDKKCWFSRKFSAKTQQKIHFHKKYEKKHFLRYYKWDGKPLDIDFVEISSLWMKGIGHCISPRKCIFKSRIKNTRLVCEVLRNLLNIQDGAFSGKIYYVLHVFFFTKRFIADIWQSFWHTSECVKSEWRHCSLLVKASSRNFASHIKWI